MALPSPCWPARVCRFSACRRDRAGPCPADNGCPISRVWDLGYVENDGCPILRSFCEGWDTRNQWVSHPRRVLVFAARVGYIEPQSANDGWPRSRFWDLGYIKPQSALFLRSGDPSMEFGSSQTRITKSLRPQAAGKRGQPRPAATAGRMQKEMEACNVSPGPCESR